MKKGIQIRGHDLSVEEKKKNYELGCYLSLFNLYQRYSVKFVVGFEVVMVKRISIHFCPFLSLWCIKRVWVSTIYITALNYWRNFFIIYLFIYFFYLVGVQVRLVAEGAAHLPDVLGLDLEGEVGTGAIRAAAVRTLQHRHHLRRGGGHESYFQTLETLGTIIF